MYGPSPSQSYNIYIRLNRAENLKNVQIEEDEIPERVL